MPINTRRLDVILEGEQKKADLKAVIEKRGDLTELTSEQIIDSFDDEDCVSAYLSGKELIVLCPQCADEVYLDEFYGQGLLECSLCGFRGQRGHFIKPS